MRKIVIYGILLSTLIFFNASGCIKESDTCHRFIYFSNKSGKDLYYIFDFIDDMGGGYNPASAPEMYKIKKNEHEKLSNSTGFTCFESWTDTPPHLVYFYLFDSHVLENTPWETVRQDSLYLKKYVLTIHDLNEMNWKITYSGEKEQNIF